ncbi:hypothetical protein HanRHA438_Chr10g0459451 [Helianthus annuus]|nr:hypothetical protein HanRHA438_Chr10g0459451 [Helianthus annuus]
MVAHVKHPANHMARPKRLFLDASEATEGGGRCPTEGMSGAVEVGGGGGDPHTP